MEEKLSVVKLHKKYVANTPEKALVVERTILLATLTKAVTKALNINNSKVYINTIIVKHLYDKKPAEEFDQSLRAIEQVVKYPNQVYENKEGKRGNWCFVKQVKGSKYLCALEVDYEEDPEDGEKEKCWVVTIFRVRDNNYLKKYKLLWSWKGDVPSS